MGVSIGYFSNSRVSQQDRDQLMLFVDELNRGYTWWCEPIWLSDQPDDSGNVFGFTKLFCMIDDEDTDTYMAFLDVREIVRFLTLTSERLQIGWRLEIEGAPFGYVANTGPDEELQNNLDSFLDMFPGDFTRLKSRPRNTILEEWSDR